MLLYKSCIIHVFFYIKVIEKIIENIYNMFLKPV
jgi:hypothetical protein